MVAEALVADWTWCSTDWAGWDFLGKNGTRLEVKQSAARQTWTKKPVQPSTCRFDISTKTGYWVGDVWSSFPEPCRPAAIYVLAHHPIADERAADHRDPHQWRFYVVASAKLPAAKTISLSHVEEIAKTFVSFDGLAKRVGDIEATLVPSA